MINEQTRLQQSELAEWWAKVQIKVDRMMQAGWTEAPHVSAVGKYDQIKVDQWISGFWPGMLWLLYEMTGEQRYREAAEPWDERMEQCFLRDNHFHHDVGFQFLPTSVIRYKLTGDLDARRRGLFAANYLAGRFNPAGPFIRAWPRDQTGWSIIDSMMNLPLLFWASEESGDPRFKHIAMAHADMVLRTFIREDGSVHHIVVFDPESGEVERYEGGQGHSPSSSWSRGQAWALYGMSCAYRYTGEERYLRAAKRVAHYFISALPEDHVAHWDFRAAADLTDEPRDTSAASCAASGLIDIARQVAPEESALYEGAAARIIRSLSLRYSTLDQPEYEGILLGATGHKPVDVNVNVSLIYGDYYYVEALAKCLGWNRNIF
ncbi:glycoside hydrolase family 88 protein [Paenibacillus sp. J5C_2022]|uniref:glycoside hydrolase family 88 protein n=1 Tax=Paenibacillus sp. J5C2022 TaxID=2977129 RepID=UPI0021D01633|nr:glycoside hydrolase family 88 protein [Paenibacillus sp. J5C2022]MCU6712288.1 glycoside hydrolase family 88 protein [Paenibacillus sp. J5C2022]